MGAMSFWHWALVILVVVSMYSAHTSWLLFDSQHVIFCFFFAALSYILSLRQNGND